MSDAVIPLLLGPVLDLVGVLAASDSEGPPGWLLVLGPAGAVGVWWALFRYYRNTDKSHSYERETLIEAQPITGTDTKVDEVRGTKRTRIEGNNVSSHRERVRRVQ
jgi:hypothetical protein